jgi:hypothetical protein
MLLLPPRGRRRGVCELGDRSHKAFAVTERDSELRQVGLAQIRQNVEVDVIFGEQFGISLEAEVLKPSDHSAIQLTTHFRLRTVCMTNYS